MEKNHILLFSPERIPSIPSLAAEREKDAYADELRQRCEKRFECRHVCSRLLDHRLTMPWDEDSPGSLLFPMVRSRRLLLGKCALRGMPEDVAQDVWDIHCFCLGTFLPPAEMDDPGLHRILSPFEFYRGHLMARTVARLGSKKRKDSYLQVLRRTEGSEDIKRDIEDIVEVFETLAQEAAGEACESTAVFVMLGVEAQCP